MNIYSGYMRMYVEYLYVPASHAIFSIATTFALLTSTLSTAPSSTPSASPSSTPSLLPFYSLFCPLFHSLGIVQVS